MPSEHAPAFVPDGYRVLNRLGSGRTSFVYLAVHGQRGRVALKLPRPETHDEPVLRRMFENEVQITLGLSHDRVVRGYDGFPTGRGAYLALEYCEGGTLDQLLLERGLLPVERAVTVVADVAEGLAEAHRRKVLHRDVKPANVFLAGDGHAKLGDFGTGIYMTEEAAERVGTAFYMAPEIFLGARASVRSDVYALGILAYEVLGGARPFTGETYDDLMLAHGSSLPRPLLARRPELPKAVERVVATAMSRDPERRFPTVAAFRDAFRGAAGLREAAPVPPGRAGRRARAPGGSGAEGSAAGSGGASGRSDSEASDASEERGRRRGLFDLFRRRKD